jgi:hypothetical protein
MSPFDYLYDHTEQTSTRFVCFVGMNRRFDLAITTTDRFFGKKLVMDIQSGRTAIIGPDDLEEDGYIAYAFNLNDDEAEELVQFLVQIVGMITFSDH